MFKKRFFLALALACITGLSFASFSTVVFNTTVASSMVDCTGGGLETFGNIGSSASNYTTRNWTGDNGVAWSATDARTDQSLNGRAIAVRSGSVKNTSTVSGGVGTISFKYARVFSGNSTLKVFVNGLQYGGDITVSSDSSTTFSTAVNVSGNVVIEIQNSGNRTIIDDVEWTCFAAPTGPEIQLADASGVNHDCGDLTVDFGSPAVNSYQDAVFTIKNPGTSTLEVSDLDLSNTDNFSIISPSTPFNVSPSGSAIVLVRFESATSGVKTGTLTVVSNDVDEEECAVNLTGSAVGPCIAPVVSNPDFNLDNLTATSVDVSISGVVADSYLAVLSTSGALSADPADGVSYNVNDALGGGVVVYNGSSSSFTVSGLTESTSYDIFVFAYNNVNCTGGPLYNVEDVIASDFETPVAPCIGGSETFNNMPSNSSSYSTRNWTGDNGVDWTATEARTDQTLNGRAIAIRAGSLSNDAPVSGGMGTLSFNYARVFTGNSTLKVFVNGLQYGGDITVSADTPTLFSEFIGVPGNVTIEIENSGNRTIIDDISWECYELPNNPEIQLLDSNSASQECGFTASFAGVGVDEDSFATFTIRNQGSLDLEISSLVLSDTSNYEIVSPTATFPIVISSLDTQDVVVRFNSASIGSVPATLTIESNDADEEECVVNLAGVALAECAAPLAEGGVTISNETDSSADIEITDTDADGYITVIMEAGAGTISAPVDGNEYSVNDMLGDGVIVHVGSELLYTISGLNPETTYEIQVIAYNNADCVNGPAYAEGYESEIETEEAPCVGGSETFSDLGSSASNYATRNWTGDNGITWTATDARTDQNLNGDAIAVRSGYVSNTMVVPGGMGTLTFNYARVFSGNSTLKVFVNGVQYGGDITVSADTATPFTTVVNATGDITLRIENSGNRTIIDDIAWDCYSASARPAATVITKEVEETDSKTTTAVPVSGDVMIYPNPNNGSFEIQLSKADEKADILIYDSLGKEIMVKSVSGHENISLDNVQKGIYFAVIKSGNAVTTKKIVVN